MATKTQVKDGAASISGTIGVFEQNNIISLISAPTKSIEATAGGIHCIIEDISVSGWSGPDPQPSPPGVTALTFAIYIQNNVGGIEDHEFHYMPSDGWSISRDFQFDVSGKQLWRTESTAASGSRTGHPVYAKDVTETDSWVDLDPVIWTVTFGSLSYSGSASPGPPPPDGTAIGNFTLVFNTHKGRDGVKYAAASSLTWDGSPINFSRYEKEAATRPPANGVYLDGLSSGIDCYVTGVPSGNTIHTVVHGIPYIVDFSVFGVWDRDGVLESDVRISGGFKASNHVPASLSWDNELATATVVGETVYPTVAQLRTVGTWTQTSGLVTGMDFRDANDQYGLLTGGARSFSITEASARENELDDTDLSIVLRVPPITATGCDEDTDWPGVAIHRRDNVGVYGPAPASSHTDWTGSGSVATADAAGAFAVTGSGALTLTVPSGYQTRLDDVPSGAAPAGPPTIYMFHKADVWTGEPDEGAYDWRGWQQLELPITAPGSGSVPSGYVGEYLAGDVGPTLADSAPSPADGTAGVGVTFGITGQVGDAIDLDDSQTTAVVSIGTAAKYNLTEATGITIAAWVKPDSAAENGFIFSRYDFLNNTGYGFQWQGTGDQLAFQHGTGAANITDLSNAVFVDNGVWVHVAVVITAAGNGTFYRNGVAAGTFSGVSISTDANDVAYIGTEMSLAVASQFGGGVDQVRIYGSALTAGQIADLGGEGGGALADLTFTLTYRTYVHTDNHLSDATRTTTYSYAVTQSTAVYTVPVASGAQTLAVTLIAPNDGDYPILERVVSIAISGFDNGAWVIGEPKLAQAANPTIVLKTFEYDYRHGGASIHADAAFEWYDADEDNAGHDNGVERTVRNFDYRQGAVSSLDLTVAYTLTQFAQLLEQVSEVFVAHRADAAFYAAVQDDESSPNQLTSCWSFNVVYPNADNPDVNPLQQSVG